MYNGYVSKKTVHTHTQDEYTGRNAYGTKDRPN